MAWLHKFLYYLNPLSKDRSASGNLNLKFMHGINRISIYVFLIAIVLLMVRYFLR